MKPPPENPDASWEKLVRRARADVGPAADLTALHRVVREAASAPARAGGWLAEFSALFVSSRALAGCCALALVCATAASWEAQDLWQALPWAQLLATTTGGAP